MGHPVLLDTWISSHQGFQSTEPAKNLPVFAGRLEPEAGVAPSLHAQLAVVLALLPVDERVAVRGLLRGGAVRHRRAALRRRRAPAVRQHDVVRLVQA